MRWWGNAGEGEGGDLWRSAGQVGKWQKQPGAPKQKTSRPWQKLEHMHKIVRERHVNSDIIRLSVRWSYEGGLKGTKVTAEGCAAGARQAGALVRGAPSRSAARRRRRLAPSH